MRQLRLIALGSALLFVGLPAHAQDELPRGNVSGFGVFTASASEGLDGGHGFGVSGAFFFSRAFGLEAGYRRQSFDVVATEANAVSGGDLAANIVTINAIGRFATGNVQPYISGGVAFISNDYSIDPTVAAQLAQFNFTAVESFDSTVGFNVGGGIDYQASHRIGLFVEGRFIAATVDTTAGLLDDVSGIEGSLPGEQKMNLFSVAGGVRIYF